MFPSLPSLLDHAQLPPFPVQPRSLFPSFGEVLPREIFSLKIIKFLILIGLKISFRLTLSFNSAIFI